MRQTGPPGSCNTRAWSAGATYFSSISLKARSSPSGDDSVLDRICASWPAGSRTTTGEAATTKGLLHLPTDPTKLRRWIERTSINPGSTRAPGVSDCNIFSFVESLLLGGPFPPKLSAALYRVIATLPGMQLIGATHDPLGRPGVALGYFFKHQPGRAELIFNPTTGVFLAERSISLNAEREGAPPGTVVGWSAIVRQGVVHSDHERPRSNS